MRGRYGNANEVLGMYDKARKKRLENQKLEKLENQKLENTE